VLNCYAVTKGFLKSIVWVGVFFYFSHGCAQPTGSDSKASSIRESIQVMNNFTDAVNVIRDNHVTPVAIWQLINHCPGDIGISTDAVTDLKVAELLAQILRNVETARHADFLRQCLSKALQALGPYNSWIENKEYLSLTGGNLKEPLGGIGLQFSQNTIVAKVLAPIEGAPADLAGVLPGDEIISVDGKSMTGVSVDDLLNLLRGDVGSPVLLTIKRAGQSQLLNFTIKRTVVLQKFSATKLLDSGIAYVALTNVTDLSVKDIRTALTAARSSYQKPLDGVVIDLRFSQGGLLYESLNLAAWFLPEDAVIAIYKRRANPKDALTSKRLRDIMRNRYIGLELPFAEELKAVPVSVLIGPSTASGAEIVAATLQDYSRAKVLGEKSLGKGSVEIIFPVSDRREAIRLTTAFIVRANEIAIEGVGVIPDEVIVTTTTPNLLPRKNELGSLNDKAIAHAVGILKSKVTQ
jgi:carboxyl-terminal processing protease